MDGHRRSLWWRWSWRDLRNHWAAVLAIAAVIAIGTGVYAGLGSTAAWRELSNDASFAELRMHDVRAELSPGTFAAQGSLATAVRTIPHSAWLDRVDERLAVDSQVDASNGAETILVSARVLGADYQDGAVVDDVWLSSGALPDARDQAAVLEQKFADYYGLPPTGVVTVTGGTELPYTGLGVAPEEFYIISPEGSILAQADLATLYLLLPTAQELVGRPGEVNDLVLTVTPDGDRDVVAAEVGEALADLEGVSAVVTTRDDSEAYRILYEDIENDQQIWNALSALVLVAAALAAFNLISRIVEAQRREIGIGMALGVARHRLAIRPVLVGLQVGVLGTAGGIAVGVLIGSLMRGLMESLVPMPHWVSPFQPDVFVRGAVFGVLPPLIASVIPVWRAVRVEPIEAIRTGHLVAAGRLATWTRQVRVPGSSLAQMPLRNLLRAPRRTVLTALGVGAAVTALVAVLAMLDSFDRAIQRGADEVTRGDPDRVVVALDTFYPVDSEPIEALTNAPAVGAVDATLRIPATVVTPGHDEIGLVLEVLDLDEGLWTPSLTTQSDAGAAGGVVLAEKAVRDLGVTVGDTVQITHPQRSGLGFELVDTTFVVSATHPNPIRNFAFLDVGFAARLGLGGVTNALQVTPSAGFDRSDVQRAAFAVDGVSSAQPVARVGEAFDEAMEQFIGFLFITAGAVLLLALLIAFNSARISVEERRREHATMIAFGVRVRRVIGIVTRESVVVGLLATAIGTLAGLGVLRWMLNSLATRTLPDFDIRLAVSPTTLAIAAVVGVVSVAVAPLLLVRRIRNMDLPDTLRVME